ncbi:monofunctional biosynthetic peptidoglycan transglycosylase [soil metagenome]
MKNAVRQTGRLIALLALSGLALQLYFLLRIAMMIVIDPTSTTFQRSEAWRLLTQVDNAGWSQRWVPYASIALPLKKAVITSEDAGFAVHGGVEWDAIEKAWDKNQRAESQAEKLNERLERLRSKAGATKVDAPTAQRPPVVPKIVGGSTITQQLAKNLFLGPERNIVRKAQEFVITFMLEAMLSKRRILEIYLNSVEWGEGVFGAEAAAHNYFRIPAAQLAPWQAARLAVMLPAPKRFEKRPGSSYVVSRAATVAARMGAVDVP